MNLDTKINIEFPLIGSLTLHAEDPGWPGYVGLYECSICRAIIRQEGAQPHADWHSNERMRNFGGF